ncbi:MAG: 5-oxoprolinase subunit PxpA [Pseudoxanthomonas sp.]|nr:5-oxoprolinase subunit PxpA [Pseudoxanthomonas sp.]
MNGTICLNADVGELPGTDGRALDAGLLALVSRCNIACGGHAGDAGSMAATIALAQERDIGIGAHPAYPDRAGFGRRRLDIAPAALAAALATQVAALQAVAAARGATVRHLKPHGALYNVAATDLATARLVVAVAADAGIGQLLGPPGSAFAVAAADAGLGFIAEGFADRSYEADGSLTPRTLPGAVLASAAGVAAQALRIVRQGEVIARTGERLRLCVQTLCLHGDTPGALALAHGLREALAAAGIAVRAGG